jgi:hypothetical protein
MSVPIHWLLVGWYQRGLIVHQQRKRPSDSNKNVNIKISVHDLNRDFDSHSYYEKGINIWIYFANFDTLNNVKIKLHQKSILYFYAFHVVKRRILPHPFWYVVHVDLTTIWRGAGSYNLIPRNRNVLLTEKVENYHYL